MEGERSQQHIFYTFFSQKTNVDSSDDKSEKLFSSHTVFFSPFVCQWLNGAKKNYRSHCQLNVWARGAVESLSANSHAWYRKELRSTWRKGISRHFHKVQQKIEGERRTQKWAKWGWLKIGKISERLQHEKSEHFKFRIYQIPFPHSIRSNQWLWKETFFLPFFCWLDCALHSIPLALCCVLQSHHSTPPQSLSDVDVLPVSNFNRIELNSIEEQKNLFAWFAWQEGGGKYTPICIKFELGK